MATSKKAGAAGQGGALPEESKTAAEPLPLHEQCTALQCRLEQIECLLTMIVADLEDDPLRSGALFGVLSLLTPARDRLSAIEVQASEFREGATT